MDRKGYTLVEILVVIALLGVFGVAIGITMNRNIKRQQENNLKEFYQKIKGAANLFASNRTDILTNLYEERGYVFIKVEDLIDAGFVQDNIINPSTNKPVDGNDQIKIEIDDAGTIVVEYPLVSGEGDYLQTKNIVIELGESVDNVCFGDINKDGLRYINSNGNAESKYLKANVNIMCDASNLEGNENRIGTYELVYEYQAKDGKWKRATRDVILEDTNGPTCPTPTPGSTTWIQTTRTITINCNDNFSCKESAITRSFINMKYATVTLYDTSNNSTECQVNVYSDNIKPTINIAANYGTSNESVTITGTGKDTISGLWYYYLGTDSTITADTIKTKGVRINPVKIDQTFTHTYTDTTYGTRKYFFYLLDEAGNFSKAPDNNGLSVTVEDHTKPTVSLNVSTSAWTKNNVTLTGKATDSKSKVKTMKLFVDGSQNGTYTVNPLKETVELSETTLAQSITAEGEHTVYLQATDVAGNTGKSTTKTVKIDKTKPVVTLDSRDKDNIKFKITDANTGSGIASYCLVDTNSSSSCTWTTYSGTNKFNTGTLTIANTYANKTSYLFAKDTAGNISNSVSVSPVSVTVVFHRYTTTSDTTTQTRTYTVKNTNNFETFSWTKAGYTLYGWNLEANKGQEARDYKPESGVTDNWINNRRDTTVHLYANWTANTNTKYTVKHYKQNLAQTKYDLANTENLTGTTDTSVKPAVKTYEGFTSPATQTATIKGDGSTVIEYYYTRKMFWLDLNGKLDGSDTGNISGFGTADVYINGKIVADNVSDYYQQHPYGTTYEIKDIKPTTGKQYNGNTSYSGTITDNVDVRLDFSTKQFTLDLNGKLDGSNTGNISGFGTADVYINGKRVKNDVDDYCATHPYGTTYEIKDIKPVAGKKYNGNTSYSGTITANVDVRLDFSTKQFTLDLNGKLDGSNTGNISGFGTADVYINGKRVKNDVDDYYATHPYGTTYEIKDINPVSGKQYNGNTSYSGTITANVDVRLDFSTACTNYNKNMYNGCTIYYITKCCAGTCNYTYKNGSKTSGTISLSSLSTSVNLSDCSDKTYSCDANYDSRNGSKVKYTIIGSNCKFTGAATDPSLPISLAADLKSFTVDVSGLGSKGYAFVQSFFNGKWGNGLNWPYATWYAVKCNYGKFSGLVCTGTNQCPVNPTLMGETTFMDCNCGDGYYYYTNGNQFCK